MTDEEKRRSPRRALRIAAMVISPQHGQIQAETSDISVGGLSIRGHVQMIKGEMCTLHFTLRVAGGGRHNISAVARVAYSMCIGMGGFKTGFDFKDVDQTSRGVIVWFCTQQNHF